MICFVSFFFFCPKAGTIVAETHPPLNIQTCDKSGCTNQAKSITVDSNWRWLEYEGVNCFTGNLWNETECPLTADGATNCASTCNLEGATYNKSFGITTNDNSLQLNFVTTQSNLTNVGSRTYLMNTDSKVDSVLFVKPCCKLSLMILFLFPTNE